MLDPHVDWRDIAEAVKNHPACANCGQAYGNAAFGAEHWCEKGYVPVGGWPAQEAPYG